MKIIVLGFKNFIGTVYFTKLSKSRGQLRLNSQIFKLPFKTVSKGSRTKFKFEQKDIMRIDDRFTPAPQEPIGQITRLGVDQPYSPEDLEVASITNRLDKLKQQAIIDQAKKQAVIDQAKKDQELMDSLLAMRNICDDHINGIPDEGFNDSF